MVDEQEQYRQYFDMSSMGHSSRAVQRYTVASMRIEEVVSAHGDYLFFENEDYSGYSGTVYLEANVMDEGQEDYFQVGERYIVTGQYDPSCHGKGFLNFRTPDLDGRCPGGGCSDPVHHRRRCGTRLPIRL